MPVIVTEGEKVVIKPAGAAKVPMIVGDEEAKAAHHRFLMALLLNPEERVKEMARYEAEPRGEL